MMNITQHNRTCGFTLIELAVVLVVIGFIVAGIVGGQALVRNARITSVIASFNRLKMGIDDFKVTFHGLPGDISDAANFFTGTVNGDGDRQILTHMNEALRAWEHLSLSQLIPGSYPGDGNGDAVVIGVDVPSSSFDEGGFWLLYNNNVNLPDTDMPRLGNFIKFGAVNATAGNGDKLNSVISPQDTASIDQKIDDGKAFEGLVIGMDGDDAVANSCGDSASNFYKVRIDTATCQVWFQIDL